jgi:hypothetical protein
MTIISDRGDFYFSPKDSHEDRMKMSLDELKKELQTFESLYATIPECNDKIALKNRIDELNKIIKDRK